MKDHEPLEQIAKTVNYLRNLDCQDSCPVTKFMHRQMRMLSEIQESFSSGEITYAKYAELAHKIIINRATVERK